MKMTDWEVLQRLRPPGSKKAKEQSICTVAGKREGDAYPPRSLPPNRGMTTTSDEDEKEDVTH
jgi:hypothetical protein